MKTKQEADKAIKTLAQFIGPRQLRAVKELFNCEEKQFFFDKMCELAEIVSTMPVTGETDGEGDAATVHLHYFAGGSANWWIIERDVDTDGEGQVQAFGLANLFGGADSYEAELGYISIPEILANGGELDFHFTPKTLEALRGKAQVSK